MVSDAEGRQVDCDSTLSGFDSHQTPQNEMRYYCLTCIKDYSSEEVPRVVRSDRMFTARRCPVCNDYVISCMRIASYRHIPPEADCDNCSSRFRCYTGGY